MQRVQRGARVEGIYLASVDPEAVAFKDKHVGARHIVKSSFCLIAIENENRSKNANTGGYYHHAFKRAHGNLTSAKKLSAASRSQ